MSGKEFVFFVNRNEKKFILSQYLITYNDNKIAFSGLKGNIRLDLPFRSAYLLPLPESEIPSVSNISYKRPNPNDPNKQDLVFFTMHKVSSNKVLDTYALPKKDYEKFLQKWADEKALLEKEYVNFLRLSVISGANLPIADINTKSSDPYVVCYWRGAWMAQSGEKYHSHIVSKSLYPTWGNQDFLIPIKDDADSLIITCRDNDEYLKDDDLGELVIPMKEIPMNFEINRWFTFTTVNEKNKTAGLKLSLFLSDEKGRGWVYKGAARPTKSLDRALNSSNQEEGEGEASGTSEILAQSYENIIVEDIESEIKNNNKETESEHTLVKSSSSTSQLPPPRPTVTSYNSQKKLAPSQPARPSKTLTNCLIASTADASPKRPSTQVTDSDSPLRPTRPSRAISDAGDIEPYVPKKSNDVEPYVPKRPSNQPSPLTSSTSSITDSETSEAPKRPSNQPAGGEDKPNRPLAQSYKNSPVLPIGKGTPRTNNNNNDSNAVTQFSRSNTPNKPLSERGNRTTHAEALAKIKETSSGVNVMKEQIEESRSIGLEVVSSGKLYIDISYMPQLGLWPAKLVVTIKRAEQLRGGVSLDPYVIAYVGKKITPEKSFKTLAQSETCNPIWNENNGWLISMEGIGIKETLNFEVWDKDSSDGLVGSYKELVWKMTDDGEHCLDLVYFPTNIPIMAGREHGKKKKLEGWVPYYPIFLVPGFASSVLTCESSKYMGWSGNRIWLDINNLLGSKLGEMASKKNSKNGGFNNRWVQHLCLEPDFSDPPEIKVRNTASFDGCMYLQTGKMGKHLAYVLGPVIENLWELGYQKKGPDQNIWAMPYDWRIPPCLLETRDGYFSTLKKTIENCYNHHKRPIVFIGHSMGNRMIHYFCHWVELQTHGKEWLDQHIQSWIACGAPWLGAPKMYRALITGESMGLNALISGKDTITFARRVGSTLFLLPEGLVNYYNNMKFATINTTACCFLFVNKEADDTKECEKPEYWRDDSYQFESSSGKKHYQPMAWEDVMKITGGEDLLTKYTNYYLSDPVFGGKDRDSLRILQRPYVKRLYNVYGVNIETEKFYFYKAGKQWEVDTACTVEVPFHKQELGYVYEYYKTPQYQLKKAGLVNPERSGDGTVPYESLSFPTYAWTGFTEYQVIEIPHTEHRNSVSTSRFFDIVLGLAAVDGTLAIGEKAKKDVKTKNRTLEKLRKKMLKKGVFEASDIAGIRKMFWKYDKDNSGSLNSSEQTIFFSELYDSLWSKVDASPEDKILMIEAWKKEFDRDGNGTLDWNEFYNALSSIVGEYEDERDKK